MQREIVRESREVGKRVAANVEHWRHIEPRYVTGRVASDVHLAIDVKRSGAALPNDLNVIRNHVVLTVVKLERLLGENPPRSTAQIPCEHDVALNEADRQVVALLIVRSALTQEGQKRNLR